MLKRRNQRSWFAKIRRIVALLDKIFSYSGSSGAHPSFQFINAWSYIVLFSWVLLYRWSLDVLVSCTHLLKISKKVLRANQVYGELYTFSNKNTSYMLSIVGRMSLLHLPRSGPNIIPKLPANLRWLSALEYKRRTRYGFSLLFT